MFVQRGIDPHEHAINVAKLVLPEAHETEARRSKGVVDHRVALDVPAKLVGPERKARGRRDVVLGAPMPEAAVEEDGDAAPDEGQVGSTWKLGMGSRPETRTAKRAAQDALRRSIAALDASHVLGAGERRVHNTGE